MRRREREALADQEREAECRRREDEAYRAGVEAGRRRCGDELLGTALTYSHNIPRHVIVMIANRWSSRGSRDDKGGSEAGVQGARAQ